MDDIRQDKSEPIPTPAPPPSSGALSAFVKFLALIAIIGLAVALLLPAVRSAPEASRRNSCMNNLKMIGLALSSYEEKHGVFPPAYTVDADGKPLHSWRTLILPYMEQEPLFKRIDLSKPWDDPANELAYNTMLDVYRCPANPDDDPEHANFTTYLAVVTPDSVIRPEESLSLEEENVERSKTLTVIEVDHDRAVHWMAPVDADEELVLQQNSELVTPHSGGGRNALFADGRIAFLHGELAEPLWSAMITATADDNGVLVDE